MNHAERRRATAQKLEAATSSATRLSTLVRERMGSTLEQIDPAGFLTDAVAALAAVASKADGFAADVGIADRPALRVRVSHRDGQVELDLITQSSGADVPTTPERAASASPADPPATAEFTSGVAAEIAAMLRSRT